MKDPRTVEAKEARAKEEIKKVKKKKK